MMKRFLFLPVIVAAFLSALAFRVFVVPAGDVFQSQAKARKNLTARKILSSLDCRSGPLVDEDPADIPALTGWGNHQWKISTGSDSAQFYFNQGINMYYAFHTIEARASFAKAIRFDSTCAMAWYGHALALGPTINFGNGFRASTEAFQAAQKALRFSGNAAPVEKDLIGAIVSRYSADSMADLKQVQQRYTASMKELAGRYNRNAEILTLYADAMMLEHPWDLYDGSTKPRPWTQQIRNILDSAFAIDSLHPGANHYLVHVLEGSAHPEEAMRSAEILAGLMPDVAHVVHMPSHIYIRTGNYKKGIDVNDSALKAYNKYLGLYKPSQEGEGLYELHAIHMKAACGLMSGNYRISIKTGDSIRQLLPKDYLQVPGAFGSYIQYVYASRLFAFVRFGKWDSILLDPPQDVQSPYGNVLSHFARGMALFHLRRLPEADNELQLMRKGMEDKVLRIPNDPNSSAYDAALVGEGILAGSLAQVKGKSDSAKKAFEKAVIDETAIIYNEPRDWLLPARQYLGNLLLKTGRYKEAVEVFREELRINPKNGWSLTGLKLAYLALNDKAALENTEKELKEAWEIRDVKIPGPVF